MRMRSIGDIGKNEWYKTSNFYSVVFNNGDSVYQSIVEGKKDGGLPYVKEGNSHLLKGSDVISFLKGEYGDIRNREQVAKDVIETLSNEELVKIITKNNILSKENRCLQKENTLLKRINVDLEAEAVVLRDKKANFEKVEHARFLKIKEHIDEVIFSGQAIRKIASELLFNCGVYFLIKENVVVYVGQSINIAGRIAQHKNDGKDFDEVRFITCEKENLDSREMFFIKLLKPELNGDYKNKDHFNIFEVVLSS